MAVNDPTVPIIATAPAAVGGSAGGTRLETPQLTAGMKYFVMWYGNAGTSGTPDPIGPQIDVHYGPQGESLSVAKAANRWIGQSYGGLEAVAGNPSEPWNGRQSQGFFSFTAVAGYTVKMATGTFGGITNHHGPLTIICLPLDSDVIVEGTDYWLDTSNLPTDTVDPEPDANFNSKHNFQVTIPDDGLYLCCWCCEAKTAGNQVAQGPDQARVGFQITPFGEAARMVPAGLNPSHGFTETRDVDDSALNERPQAFCWYSLETLPAGLTDFDVIAGQSGFNRNQTTQSMRVAVFRNDSLPKPIQRIKLASVQANLVTAAPYADIPGYEVTMEPLDGFHVVLDAGAHLLALKTLETGYPRTQLTQLWNEAQQQAYAQNSGSVANQDAYWASSYTDVKPVCALAGVDVTGDGGTTWKVQRRVTVNGTGTNEDPVCAYGVRWDQSTLIESNLIVWPWGTDPVPAVVDTPSYRVQVQTLVDYLPGGAGWVGKRVAATGNESVLRQFLRALATEMIRETEAIELFKLELNPDKTTLFIDEWEKALGIPDGCFKGTGTIDERRTDVLTKLAAVGVQTKSDFIVLAQKFNLDIQIANGVEHGAFPMDLPFILFAGADAPKFTIVVTYDLPDAVTFPYTFPIPFTTQALAILECLFNKLKPANCQVVFIAN